MKYVTGVLLLLAGCAAMRAEPSSEWVSLFNGKDLSGWHVACVPEDRGKDYWSVEDGMIVCDSMGDGDHDYVWLMSDGAYDDFELKLKVRSWEQSTGNSGVQVRSRYDEAARWLDGPQVDLHPRGPWRCGFIYDETREVKRWLWPDVGGPANAKPKHAPEGWTWEHHDEGDGWNDVYIRCEGTRIVTKINGVTVADYDGEGELNDEDHRRHNVGMNGHLALQLHSRDKLRIAFKDIYIRQLGD